MAVNVLKVESELDRRVSRQPSAPAMFDKHPVCVVKGLIIR